MVDHRTKITRDLILVTLLTIPFIWLVFYFNFLTDDSFISFRYAANLVHGHGLRYNINENPPVEGYSNFLWVLVLAFFMKLGADPTNMSRVLSGLCGVALLISVYWACRRVLYLDRLRSSLGTLSLALCPPIIVWSTGGLETMPFALCFFLLLISFLRARETIPIVRVSVFGLILIMLRPEGMAFPVIIGVLIGFYYYFSKKPGRWRRYLCFYFAVLAAGLVLLTLWRLIYFKSLLPNTFYAKIGFTPKQLVRGFDYVAHFFLDFPGMVIILVGAAIYSIWGRRREIVLLLALALILVAMALVFGGDFMTMARLLVPLAPLTSLLLAGAVCPRATGQRRVAVVFLTIATLAAIGSNLLPAYNLHATPKSWRNAVDFRWNNTNYVSERDYWEQMKRNTAQWEVVGKTLGAMSSPDQSVVTGGIGAIGYYSKMRIYDLYGLVSREVAHRTARRDVKSAGHDKSVDGFYFFKYEPDYLMPRLIFPEDLEDWKKELWRSILQRSKSWNRRNIRQSIERFHSLYFIYTQPVSYEQRGEKMLLITYKLKDSPSPLP